MIIAPYIGIDESNHGNWPEIIVAAWSLNPKSILWHEEKLPKKRTAKSISFLSTLGSFRHMIIPEEYELLVNAETRGVFYKLVKIVSVCEFLKSFSEVRHVIIDGESPEDVLEEIKKQIYHNRYKPKIESLKSADQRILIVNLADSIAYRLYSHYSGIDGVEHKPLGEIKQNQRSTLLQSLVTPVFENYLDLLERL